MTSLLFNRCYFNLTFPQTGTEHQNKNTFDDRVYTRKIDTINGIFISIILKFRLRGQQSLPITRTSKIKNGVFRQKTMFRIEWAK